MVLPRSEFQNGVSSTQKDARQTVTEILALIQKQFENGGIVYFWYELAIMYNNLRKLKRA